MPPEKLIRGTHIVPLLHHIQSEYDAQMQQSIYESLSDETRATLGQPAAEAWYPFQVAAEMNRGIFNAHSDAKQGYEAVRASGAAIAEYGVNTFMRLLIKLMTPEMLAKKWPTIWSKSHNFGRMEVEIDRERDRRLMLILKEVDDYTNIGPCAVGFLSYSLRAMGRTDAAVTEPDVDYSRQTASSYRFEVTW